jgi:hypothetical protein
MQHDASNVFLGCQHIKEPGAGFSWATARLDVAAMVSAGYHDKEPATRVCAKGLDLFLPQSLGTVQRHASSLGCPRKNVGNMTWWSIVLRWLWLWSVSIATAGEEPFARYGRQSKEYVGSLRASGQQRANDSNDNPEVM